MGRRSLAASSASNLSDLDPVYRKFLSSSLDRNDAELVAIVKLHEQLRELRNLLVKRYGELSLFPEDDSTVPKESLSSDVGNNEKEKLLVAFRLRLKLRRKLLNRLVRRLNRVAHFMDGEVSSVVAPSNPKYGDLRFEFNSEKFEHHQEVCRKRERAFELLREKRRKLNEDVAEKYMLDAEEILLIHDEQQHQDDEEIKKEGPLKEEMPTTVPLSDLLEYDAGYCNKTNPVNPMSTSLTEQETSEYTAIKLGSGVGAIHKSMTIKEKEVEYARWAQEILTRIPEQPTFEQLGMGDNHVFLADERKKKLLGEENEISKKQKLDNDDSSYEDDDEKIKTKENAKVDPMGDSATKQLSTTDEAQPEDISKSTFYLSLQPVPSFAQQDLRRIRAIQADFVMAALLSQYKAKIDEATKEYNETVARSTELQNIKIRLQSDLHKVIVHSRSLAQKSRNDYALDVAIARGNWQRRKEQWEATQRARQRNRSDPSTHLEIRYTLKLIVDQIERRAAYLIDDNRDAKKKLTPHDVTVEAVKITVRDMVNTVVDRCSTPTPSLRGDLAFGPTSTTNEWNYDLSGNTFGDFVPPPPPDELDPTSSSKQQEEQEAMLRRQISAVETRFVSSEEDRKRVWRKLQKLRQEFDPHQSQLAVHGSSSQPQQASRATQNISRPRAVVASSSASANHHPNSSQMQQASSADSHPQPPARNPAATAAPAAVQAKAPTAPSAPSIPVSYNYRPPSTEVATSITSTTTTIERQHTSAVGVPEALVAAYAAAVESAESPPVETFASQPPGASLEAGGQVYGKAIDKYGGKYSVEKVRERIFPDGSVMPVQQPKRTKEGLYQRPAGRQRKGMDWDSERGVWIPLPGATQDTYLDF